MVSIAECRRILGESAEGMTDQQVEGMRAELERTADVMFDAMIEAGKNGLEAARWISYARETGEVE